MYSGRTDDLFDAEDPYVGQVLNDRFIVENKLGEGGFGAVYKGVQKGTNRVVAIKLLHPEMTRDKNVVERFRREGQVLCSLRDAHSVTTYDFDQTKDGTLFIAMELLEGRSLHEVYANEAPIAWPRMVKILSEMCTSLAEAHALGVVHRDLKPENVHLEKRTGNDEFVKILDFGIAKMLRGDGIGGNKGPQLTATGQTLGTLEFMSPEQLMGKELDGRSDIYGMGVLAYELMTARLPFPDAIGPAMLISAQLKRIPDLPSVAYPKGNIPREVDELIFKMLQKDKTNRHPDVSAVRAECLSILSRQSMAVSAASLPAIVAHTNSTPAPGQSPMAHMAEAASAAPLSASDPEPGPSTRAIIAATAPHSKWVLIAVLLALLAAGGAAAFFLTR
jgi:serine/threonine-protein kinase